MKNELKIKQYMFTFEEGGWNTVWAKTLRGAKKLAVQQYKDYINKIRFHQSERYKSKHFFCRFDRLYNKSI